MTMAYADDADRKSGWYWVVGLGDEPQLALWDQTDGMWNVVGGYEDQDSEGITVISERLEPPTYWRTLTS